MKFMVLGWEKYNPRADYKSMPWFRMDSLMPSDRKLHGMTLAERWLWVVLLCVAARENKSGVFDADISWLSDQAKVDQTVVQVALDKFQDLDLIKIATDVKRSRRVRGTSVNVRETFATDETKRTDETDLFVVAEAPTSPATSQPDLFPNDREIGPPSPRKLAEVWNEECRGAMRKVILSDLKSGSKRWNAAKARLSDYPDLDQWRELAKRVAKTRFWRGEVPPGAGRDKPFIGNFDTFVRPDTRTKILEGAYDERIRSRDPFAGLPDLNAPESEASGG